MAWRLTFYGWVGMLASFTIAVYVFLVSIHGFLMIDRPTPAKLIVVSGTMPDSALEEILRLHAGTEDLQIATVGGPINRGSHLAKYGSYAQLAAESLRSLAYEGLAITAVPTGPTQRDRVFASAIALKNWLGDNPEIDSVTVYALGVRGRRTLILFRRALGPELKVGVVSIPSTNYDPSRWWVSSEGFRTVISELIAYLYVKTFFSPEVQPEVAPIQLDGRDVSSGLR